MMMLMPMNMEASSASSTTTTTISKVSEPTQATRSPDKRQPARKCLLALVLAVSVVKNRKGRVRLHVRQQSEEKKEKI